MFQIKIQTVSTDRKGNPTYENLKTLSLASFSESTVTALDAKIEANNEDPEKVPLRSSFYIAHTDTVPEGWASKKLEYTTQIWRATVLSEADALTALADLPF
mgnify:CR=1 FL=1